MFRITGITVQDPGIRVHDPGIGVHDGSESVFRMVRNTHEIREVLELRNSEDSTCEHVAGLLRAKIEAVDEQIKGLKAFRRDLGKSLRACESTVPSHDADCCPVIERLDAGRKTGRTN